MSKKLRPIHPGAGLIGMFLVLDTTDHEHYRIGHIAAAVGDCYLIQFDKLEEKIRYHRWSYTRSISSAGPVRIAGRKLANLFETLRGDDGVDRRLNQPKKPS